MAALALLAGGCATGEIPPDDPDDMEWRARPARRDDWLLDPRRDRRDEKRKEEERYGD